MKEAFQLAVAVDRAHLERSGGWRAARQIDQQHADGLDRDLSPTKPRTVMFTSGEDDVAKQFVILLINSTGFIAIDLGSLATGGAMHEVGAP